MNFLEAKLLPTLKCPSVRGYMKETEIFSIAIQDIRLNLGNLFCLLVCQSF